MSDNAKRAFKALNKARNEARKDLPQEVENTSVARTKKARVEAVRVSQIKPAVALNEEEKSFFRAVATHLEMHNALEAVDTMVLTMLARNMFKYTIASAELQCLDDYWQEHTNGAKSPSVAAQLEKAAEDQILKLSTKLGLSPADREKIEALRLKQQDDDEEKDDILS